LRSLEYRLPQPYFPLFRAHQRWRTLFDPAALASLMRQEPLSSGQVPYPPLAGTLLDPIQLLQYQDIKTRLPDAVLTGIGAAAAAHGLDVHFPLLDPRLVDFAFSLPLSARLACDGAAVRGGHLLPGGRQEPAPLLPLEHWLGGPLRDMVRDVFASTGDVFYTHLDRARTTQFLEGCGYGATAFGAQVWALLMLKMWFADPFRWAPVFSGSEDTYAAEG